MGWLGLGGALSSDDRRDIAPIVESPTFVHPGVILFFVATGGSTTALHFPAKGIPFLEGMPSASTYMLE